MSIPRKTREFVRKPSKFKIGDVWARVKVVGVEKATRIVKVAKGVDEAEEGWEVVFRCACGATWAIWEGEIKKEGKYIKDCGCGISRREKSSQVVSVLINRDLLREVGRRASQEGRSRNGMIVEAIRKGISK